jgi:hypothetical protein
MSRVRDPAVLTCREIVELVTDYECAALDAGDRARFEQHLFACTWCMDYLKQMRTTVALTGEPRGTEPVDHARLGAFFRAARTKKGEP